MSAADDSNPVPDSQSSSTDARMAALEREVAELRSEVTALRVTVQAASASEAEAPSPPLTSPFVDPVIAAALRQVPVGATNASSAGEGAPHGRPSFSERLHSD